MHSWCNSRWRCVYASALAQERLRNAALIYCPGNSVAPNINGEGSRSLHDRVERIEVKRGKGMMKMKEEDTSVKTQRARALTDKYILSCSQLHSAMIVCSIVTLHTVSSLESLLVILDLVLICTAVFHNTHKALFTFSNISSAT